MVYSGYNWGRGGVGIQRAVFVYTRGALRAQNEQLSRKKIGERKKNKIKKESERNTMVEIF